MASFEDEPRSMPTIDASEPRFPAREVASDDSGATITSTVYFFTDVNVRSMPKAKNMSVNLMIKRLFAIRVDNNSRRSCSLITGFFSFSITVTSKGS